MLLEHIDLDANSGLAASDNYSSVCRRLVTKIFHIQNYYTLQNRINFDRIYVPHTILNILSDITGFYSYQLDDFSEDQPVGKLGDQLDIYVSLTLNRNQVLFSFDKILVRDIKLESLLDGQFDPHLQEVILEIKSEFLL